MRVFSYQHRLACATWKILDPDLTSLAVSVGYWHPNPQNVEIITSSTITIFSNFMIIIAISSIVSIIIGSGIVTDPKPDYLKEALHDTGHLKCGNRARISCTICAIV